MGQQHATINIRSNVSIANIGTEIGSPWAEVDYGLDTKKKHHLVIF